MRLLSIFLLFLAHFSYSQTTILFDDFQSGIPLYYSMVDADGFIPDASVSEYTSAWISADDPENPANKVASSTSYFDPAGRADRWLISPQITLGAFGNYLKWQGKSHDAFYAEDYIVMLSTTTNELESFTDTIHIVVDESEFWTTHEINLTEQGYNNIPIYLAFGLRTYDGFKLYLDSIYVRKNDPVGIEEATTIAFSIYPNPAAQVINIEFEGEFEQIRIIDISGQIVLVSSNRNINVEQLQAGVYFVELVAGNSRAVQRIVKN